MSSINRHVVRRTCQLLVLGAFAATPWLNARDFRPLTGNLLSSTFLGVHLADPLAALQVLVSTRQLSFPLLSGAGITLILALCMGPVFCSWICPYGLMADLLSRIFPGRKKRTPAGAFWMKWAGVGLVLAAIGTLGLPPLLNHLSLPGWCTRTTQALWLSGAVPAGFWLLPMAAAMDLGTGSRFWCRYICPQSLLLETAGRLLPQRFRVLHDVSRCTCVRSAGSTPCQTACPLGIDPKKRIIDPECTNCGECVVACARHGKALSQGIGPRRITPEGRIS